MEVEALENAKGMTLGCIESARLQAMYLNGCPTFRRRRR
jgi:hypothetical protein